MALVGTQPSPQLTGTRSHRPVYACPQCGNRPLLRIYQLRCGHVVCQTCAKADASSDVVKDGVITCIHKSCLKRTPLQEIQQLPPAPRPKDKINSDIRRWKMIKQQSRLSSAEISDKLRQFGLTRKSLTCGLLNIPFKQIIRNHDDVMATLLQAAVCGLLSNTYDHFKELLADGQFDVAELKDAEAMEKHTHGVGGGFASGAVKLDFHGEDNIIAELVDDVIDEDAKSKQMLMDDEIFNMELSVQSERWSVMEKAECEKDEKAMYDVLGNCEADDDHDDDEEDDISSDRKPEVANLVRQILDLRPNQPPRVKTIGIDVPQSSLPLDDPDVVSRPMSTVGTEDMSTNTRQLSTLNIPLTLPLSSSTDRGVTSLENSLLAMDMYQTAPEVSTERLQILTDLSKFGNKTSSTKQPLVSVAGESEVCGSTQTQTTVCASTTSTFTAALSPVSASIPPPTAVSLTTAVSCPVSVSTPPTSTVSPTTAATSSASTSTPSVSPTTAFAPDVSLTTVSTSSATTCVTSTPMISPPKATISTVSSIAAPSLVTSSRSIATTSSSSKSGKPAIIRLLSKVLRAMTDSSAALLGASVNDACSRVVLDVAEGQRHAAQEFLKKFLVENRKYTVDQFDIVEQGGTVTFLVAVGQKVANTTIENNQAFMNRPARELVQNFGTVTCLAEDNDDQKYVLTSNHVVHYKQSIERERINGVCQTDARDGRKDEFISVLHNNLRHVSSVFTSVFAPISFPDDDENDSSSDDDDEHVGAAAAAVKGAGAALQNRRRRTLYNVDIAALKLNDAFSSTNPCACLSHPLPECYRGSDFELMNVIVRKHGAQTGTTCGRVLCSPYPFRFPTSQQQLSGEVFDVANSKVPTLDRGYGMLVIALERGESFAERGDSGALVWSKDGVPIGLVSLKWNDYKYEGRRVPVTYVVRLDRCLDALQESCPAIGQLSCAMHDCPVPIMRTSDAPADDMPLVAPADQALEQ